MKWREGTSGENKNSKRKLRYNRRQYSKCRGLLKEGSVFPLVDENRGLGDMLPFAVISTLLKIKKSNSFLFSVPSHFQINTVHALHQVQFELQTVRSKHALVWNMLIGQIFENGRTVLKSVVNY